MKISSIVILGCLLLLLNFKLDAQEKLISETDSIAIFDTYISLNSSENVSPVIYNDGIIYASAHKSNDYQLFFSDLKSKSKKIKTGRNYNSGLVAVYKDDIYFMENLNHSTSDSSFNLTIKKGVFENFKISKTTPLPICKNGFYYEYPAISGDGKQMAIVTNENGMVHLLELTRNNENEWSRSSVVFIAQVNFNIINPTFYNENTMYFSSNMIHGKVKIDGVKYEMKDGQPKITDVFYETGVYNIYKIVRIEGRWQLPVKQTIFSSDFDDLGVVFKTEKSGYINTFRYDNTDNIYYFELK
jgi:hypothetical protein